MGRPSPEQIIILERLQHGHATASELRLLAGITQRRFFDVAKNLLQCKKIQYIVTGMTNETEYELCLSETATQSPR